MPNNAEQHHITYEEFVTMQTAYLNNPEHLTITQLNGSKVALKALRIPVEAIRKIIDREDEVPVKYLSAFFVYHPQPDFDHINIAFGGIADGPDNPAEDGGILLKDELYDYCVPCPTTCPLNV